MSETPLKGDKGDKGDRGLPSETSVLLVQEVQRLVGLVTALNNRMQHFPDREEVKREGRSRTLKALVFGVALILIAQFLTITTVSYCFLTPQPGTSSRPICSGIPGYDRAIEDGESRLARFELLLTQIDSNKKLNEEQDLKIEKLKLEIKQLKEQTP